MDQKCRFTADEILHRCHAVDYVVQGEGEEAFYQLISALQNGKDGLQEEIPGVRGRHISGRTYGLYRGCRGKRS